MYTLSRNITKLNMLLTINQVAQRFNLRPNTIRVWIMQGKLKSVKIGGARRIEESEADKLIKS
jgi:excisionase family DNA binding protein